jgi:hypothetical protein
VVVKVTKAPSTLSPLLFVAPILILAEPEGMVDGAVTIKLLGVPT